MKNIIVFFLVVTGFSAFSQEWKTVKMDSAVSFKLPKGFQRNKSDTTNNFSATTAFGTILIFKAADNSVVTPDIERDKHLTNYYNDYRDRVQKSTSDGKITNEKDSMLGDLKVKDFTLEIDTGGGVQVRKFRLLHANNATYAFEFLFEAMHREYAAEECNQFFNSIQVSENMEREDQFTDLVKVEKPAMNPYLIGGGVLLAIAVVVFLVKRKKKHKH